jgi:hypothetical protein
MKYVKVVLLCISILASVFAFSKINNTAHGNHYDKCITIITTINNHSTIEEYCTNKEYLGEVVDENMEELDAAYSGEITDPFGRLLIRLKGYNIKNNEFFFIYVNGEYGRYGVDQQIIEDGGKYEFRLGTY